MIVYFVEAVGLNRVKMAVSGLELTCSIDTSIAPKRKNKKEVA